MRNQEEIRLEKIRQAENRLVDKLAELVINNKGGNTYALASHEEYKKATYDLIDALNYLYDLDKGEENGR
jgi:hypothetical protein